MATHISENSKAGEYMIFDQIFKYAYPGATKKQYEFCRKMIEDGTLAVESLLELSISNLSGIEREPTKGKDFVDGSDAKKATTVLSSAKQDRYRANISNTKGKIGSLRCVIANTLANRVEYFLIPYEYHQQYKNSVKIYYSRNGELSTPAVRTFRRNSFEDLCK